MLLKVQRVRFLLFFLFLAPVIPHLSHHVLHSQTSEEIPFNLQNALLAYLNHHPSIIQMNTRIDAAISGRDQSYILFFPFQMSAEGHMAVDAHGVTGDGSVSLTYDVIDIGQVSAYKKQSTLIQASKEAREWQKQILTYQLISEILDLQEAMDLKDLAQNRYRSLEQSASAAEQRFELGVLTRTEYEFSQSKLSAAQAELLKAELQCRLISDQLESKIDLNLSQTLSTAPYLPFPDFNEAEDELPLADWTHLPLEETRSDLKQLELLAFSINHDIAGVRSSTIPDFRVSTGGYQLFSGTPEFRLSLRMSIPLGSAFYDTEREKQFLLSKETALAAHQLQMTAARMAVKQAITRLVALQEIENAYQQAIDHSAATLEGVEKEYNSGFKTLFELLSAQTSHYNLIRQYEEIHIDLRRALLDLYFNTGRLNIENLVFPEQ